MFIVGMGVAIPKEFASLDICVGDNGDLGWFHAARLGLSIGLSAIVFQMEHWVVRTAVMDNGPDDNGQPDNEEIK